MLDEEFRKEAIEYLKTLFKEDVIIFEIVKGEEFERLLDMYVSWLYYKVLMSTTQPAITTTTNLPYNTNTSYPGNWVTTMSDTIID